MRGACGNRGQCIRSCGRGGGAARELGVACQVGGGRVVDA